MSNIEFILIAAGALLLLASAYMEIRQAETPAPAPSPGQQPLPSLESAEKMRDSLAELLQELHVLSSDVTLDLEKKLSELKESLQQADIKIEKMASVAAAEETPVPPTEPDVESPALSPETQSPEDIREESQEEPIEEPQEEVEDEPEKEPSQDPDVEHEGQFADRLAEKIVDEREEIQGDTLELSGRSVPEVSGPKVSRSEEEIETVAEAEPVAPPVGRYRKIYQMQDEGLPIDEIARQMSMGKGEIQLILSLREKG
jgi:hypothetical protein